MLISNLSPHRGIPPFAPVVLVLHTQGLLFTPLITKLLFFFDRPSSEKLLSL